MIDKKSKDYTELVYRMKEKWALNMEVNGKEVCICNEINLWTYWQGLGYAEKTPKIKYLLVGQDWGNPFLSDNRAFINRIIAMNNGNKSIPYIDRNDKIYPTDKNLIELFKVLGYSDIANNCYEDLFFTNFCLAYRTGKESGNLPTDIRKAMEESSPLFKDLCSILEPKKILCLGKQTFQHVYETLNYGKKAGDLQFFKNRYNDFLENHVDFKVKCGNADTMIYPLAHCGSSGTMGRNKGRTKQSDLLYYQKQDWARCK